jgi:hypothetical protein
MQQRFPAPGWPAEAVLVRVAGTVREARVEPALDPANIDHVWISLDAGFARPVEVAINTLSRRNRDAGFDPRVRVGILREPWTELPELGARGIASFSYADHEAREDIVYERLEREQVERLLLDAAARCVRAEAIGTPYHRRPIMGVHQIHSRRASCAVAEDLPGRDGALRFHFETPAREAWWMFFKFCGQP